jgi:hypothetical protein
MNNELAVHLRCSGAAGGVDLDQMMSRLWNTGPSVQHN